MESAFITQPQTSLWKDPLRGSRDYRREAVGLVSDVLICCLSSCIVGNFKGLCKQIDHFLEDTEYEADTAEYFLRKSTASFFPPLWTA